MRKLSEIWNSIDEKRPQDIKIIAWKQSYEGVKAAIEYIGYVMVTTKEEFDSISIPINKVGHKSYGSRKIIVTRDGVQSVPTQIQGLLIGTCGLLTPDELNLILKKVNDEKSLNQPKGIPTNNDKETNAIDKLDDLLDIEKYLDRQHLIEHRIADIAYRFKNKENYVADQVKSAYFKVKNEINFSVKIGGMITILEKNMSLTCIAMKDDKVDIVWFFYGIKAIDVLITFEKTKTFKPRCHLTCKSDNPFTLALNDPRFRYDVGKSELEIDRLLQQKLEFARIGVKHSIQYLNEDDTQIMCPFHRIEQKSFEMTRDACAMITINVKKCPEDNYSVIDFRMNDRIKIQDKSYKKHFVMRAHGKLPYNPDTIDIFQLSNLITKEIYAIPMRKIKKNIVKSTFPPDILMKTDIKVSQIWDTKYAKYKYDLKTEKGIRAYVATCEAAAAVPQLTDREFYKNMLDANAEKFGSLKQLAERKAAK